MAESGQGTRSLEPQGAVVLPEEFTIAVSTEYLWLLMDRVERGEDILLDGGSVTRIDTAAIQLLFVVQRALAEQGLGLQWQEASQVVKVCVALLGLDRDVGQQATVGEDGAGQPAGNAEGWRIDFRPYPNLLKTGNDPVRMFRELAGMGELKVKVDTTKVPHPVDLDAEECFLGWSLTLAGPVPLEQINEIFEWVNGDCDLSIEPLGVPTQPSRPEPYSEAVSPAMTAAQPLSRAGEAHANHDDRRGTEDRRCADRRAGPGSGGSKRVDINKID